MCKMNRLMSLLQTGGLIVFLLTSSGVIAENPSDTLYLDLNKAIGIAGDQNPTLRVARLEVESREAGIQEVRGSYLPSLNVSGGYNRNIMRPIIFLPDDSPFGGDGYLEVGSDNSFMATLSAQMPLYNPALNRSLDAARADRDLAGEQMRASRIELEYNVHLAFFDALLARESRDVMRKSLRNATENLERTRRMYEQGTVAEYDLIRAEVQTENMRPGVLQSENAYEQAVDYLKALIGVDKSQPLSVRGNLTDMAENQVADFRIADASRSLDRNTDLVQMDLQLNLLNHQKETARASGLPSLGLAGNYQYQTESNHFRFDDFRWVETFSAGVSLTIPLFNGFAVRQQTRQLEIAADQVKLQRDYLEDNLDIQLEGVLKSMMVALEKTANARSNVRMAERGYEIAKTRYESGQGTLMELNDSEVALTQARFNLLQAKHEILQAKAEYDRFIGDNNNL